MTRVTFGMERGDFGISAKPCPARLSLSIPDLRPGAVRDPACCSSEWIRSTLQNRIPDAAYRIYGKTAEPVRDLKGLRLMPDATLADAQPLDVLHVPGGFGQEALDGRHGSAGLDPTAGCGREQHLLRVHGRPALWRSRPPQGTPRRRTGLRFTCCRSLVRSRSTNVWS
jgi:hypothetical protein